MEKIEIVSLYPNSKPRKARMPLRSSRMPHKPRKLAKRTKRRKVTKTAILASYGLPKKFSSSSLRYKQPIERGILWYWFSRFIRERDKDLPCISCGNMKEDMHGGHFIPTGQCSWDGMVFDEDNVHAECSACNLRDKVKLRYAFNLDKRTGEPMSEYLRQIFNDYRFGGNTYKNWSRDKYKEKISYYRQTVNNSVGQD